jgi:hypothetical protein
VPGWSRSRHELVYQSGDQLLAVSDAIKGNPYDAEKPRADGRRCPAA